jgi:hypothetical protein
MKKIWLCLIAGGSVLFFLTYFLSATSLLGPLIFFDLGWLAAIAAIILLQGVDWANRERN